MAPLVSVNKLLELNLMSAQDLAPVSKSMRTYAVAWVDPNRKLTTRVAENDHANPTWNEKFVFRVDDDSLKSDSCTITIEVYALTWLKVVLVGTVHAPLKTLIPPSGSKTRIPSGGATMRFVTLQINRPSGRPQGTINLGISVINSPIHSMPLHSEVSASHEGYDNHGPTGGSKHKLEPERVSRINLWRSRSERTIDRYSHNPRSTICDDSMIKCGSVLGSMVSDVGPSASIVAAAIAKGIYPRKVVDETESSVLLDNWADNNSVEGLKTKIERWRKELPPVPHRENQDQIPKLIQERGRPRRHSDGGGGLFSCFGSALGCEFSISCGGGGAKKHRYNPSLTGTTRLGSHH